MEYRLCDRFQKTQNDAEVCMFSSVPRIAGLLAATSMALASLATAAHAQTGSQGRPDATNVQMVSVPETYCRSIDNTDMTGQDYYFSAADVTAKSGKVIQSHNGGSCCTAAAPWNGSACQAVPTCTNDKDLIGWSCVATADSCARVGMTLINGACGVAVPPPPPCYTIQTSGGIYGTNKTANYLALDPNFWVTPLISYIPGATSAVSSGTQNNSGSWFVDSYTNVDYARPSSFNLMITGVQNITKAVYSPSVWYTINVERITYSNNLLTAPSGPTGSSAEIYVNDQLAGRTVYGPGGNNGSDTVANTILPKLKEGMNKITFFLKGKVEGTSQDGWTFYFQSRFTADLVFFGARCN